MATYLLAFIAAHRSGTQVVGRAFSRNAPEKVTEAVVAGFEADLQAQDPDVVAVDLLSFQRLDEPEGT